MKVAKQVLSLLVLASMALAQPAPSDSGTAPRKTKKAAHKTTVSEQELREIRDAMKAQQDQIDQLKQQMAQRDQQLQQTQQQLQDAQKAASDAQAKSSELESSSKTQAEQVKAVQADVTDVKGALNSTAQTVQEEQKRVGDLEHPTAIHYKGMTITPGGFIAAENGWRQHTEQSDAVGSSFNGIPYNGDPRGGLTEFRMTARQSRLSLLGEGKVGGVKLTGYWEADFLGAAPTANENQSNSFNMRQRQLFGQAALNSGWTFTAGQTWSLMTMNKKGIETRGEWIPATIDSQYIVGYNWLRVPSARVSKTFADKKVTAALSIENSAVLPYGTIPSNVQGLPGGNQSTGTALLGNGNNYTTSLAPDVLVKVAFDPGWGHYEIKGVGRFLRDKVVGSTNSNMEFGGGVGAGFIVPVVKNKVDLIAQGMYGSGTSRYNDSGNADLYVQPDGSIHTIHSGSFAGGFELHPTPKLDIYLYGGTEYQQRSSIGAGIYPGGTTAAQFGYGNPNLSYAGCYGANFNSAAFSCSAPFKNLSQGNAGFWYRFYKGPYGTLQYGMQYSYTTKNAWAGSVGGVSRSPNAVENMAFTSFRYYIP